MKGTSAMNKVKVTICGKDFNLKTDEEPEYLIGLAKKVDEEIANMVSATESMSIQSAAILVALSAFDEAKKSSDSIDNIRTQIKEYVDEACQARSERDDLLKKEKILKAKISSLENELKIKRMKSDINEQLTFDKIKPNNTNNNNSK